MLQPLKSALTALWQRVEQAIPQQAEPLRTVYGPGATWAPRTEFEEGVLLSAYFHAQQHQPDDAAAARHAMCVCGTLRRWHPDRHAWAAQVLQVTALPHPRA